MSDRADPPNFGDFRKPDPDESFSSFVSCFLDQFAWVEEQGLDSVWLTCVA